jgi:hypothetical protein
MPYFNIPNSATAVEALGQVDGRDCGETTIHYMSFAGPAEAAKAVWAHAVSSKKQGRVQSTWRPGKLLKPNQAAKVKLPTSSYVHYILRAELPNFLLVLDPRAARIPDYGQVHPYKASKTYTDLKQLLPAWEPTTEYDTVRDVRTWLRDQPTVQAELARKLVNALNSFTKVPVLDEWGLTLLDHLPMAAKIEVDCHGDAVTALLLRTEFKWHDWISGLLKRNVISIPNKE